VQRLGKTKVAIFGHSCVAYFDSLTAPSKKLVWFEHSGHEPFVDEPGKFNAAMAELVRPAPLPDLQHAPRVMAWKLVVGLASTGGATQP
jgi:hypothetical protein